MKMITLYQYQEDTQNVHKWILENDEHFHT